MIGDIDILWVFHNIIINIFFLNILLYIINIYDYLLIEIYLIFS